LLTIAGDGTALSSHILWPSITLPAEFNTLPLSIKVHPNSSGWMTAASFQSCMETLADEIDRKRRRCKLTGSRALLIVDGHSSRRNPALWKIFDSHRIDLLLLPPHTSHLLQPLDRFVNANFKTTLSRLWKPPTTPAIGLYRAELSRCLPEALHLALAPFTIKESWKATGILPLSPSTIICPLIAKYPETEAFLDSKKGGHCPVE
jgi:hypothetical protein